MFHVEAFHYGAVGPVIFKAWADVAVDGLIYQERVFFYDIEEAYKWLGYFCLKTQDRIKHTKRGGFIMGISDYGENLDVVEMALIGDVEGGEPIPAAAADAALQYYRDILAGKKQIKDSPTSEWVKSFAQAMEFKLSLNRHKGDVDAWQAEATEWLLTRLLEEVAELRETVSEAANATPQMILAEAADVGNIAMMVADAFIHKRFYDRNPDDDIKDITDFTIKPEDLP